MHAFAPLVTALLCSATVLAAQCYFPNGGAVDSDTACNPNALVSACCYDNQACLSNGLCVSDPHDPVNARLHRGTCTDKQWKSGNCPRNCLDIDNNGAPVFSCNSTTSDSYCCYDGCDCQPSSGSDIFTLAQSPADVYTLTIIGESFTQTHISTTTTSSATGSVSASNGASTTGASSAADPGKKSNTTALGAGLGVGLPVAALIGIVLFFLFRRRRNRGPDSLSSELAADEYAACPTSPSTNVKYAHMAEAELGMAPVVSVTHELSGQRNEKPVELPADASSVPSTAGGAQAVELDSPLNPPAGGVGSRSS